MLIYYSVPIYYITDAELSISLKLTNQHHQRLTCRPRATISTDIWW